MSRTVVARNLALGLAFLPPTLGNAPSAPADDMPGEEKLRVLVLTDIGNEPDDSQSMVRFLLYTNEFGVEGLVATSSTHLKDRVNPRMINERVEAYGKVRDNLLEHADGYPPEAYLRERISSSRSEGKSSFLPLPAGGCGGFLEARYASQRTGS